MRPLQFRSRRPETRDSSLMSGELRLKEEKMSRFHFKRTAWTAGIGFAAMTGALVLALPTPAMAIDGRTAVGQCIDSTATGARCAWSVNGKGEIDICNKSGCVYCPSATGQCAVAARSRPHPTMPFPVGTKVVTAVGTFEIGRRHVASGPLASER
jgi:hypothetical protein